MKNKINTISFKLILSFFVSVLISCLCIFFLCNLLIVASSNKSFAKFFFKHIISFFLLFFTLFIGIIIIIFLIITRKKRRYLEDITETIENISKDNIDINIPVDGTDELGRLASSINVMSHRLKTLIEEERRNEKLKNQLITNMSHDLRTPLTSVLGYMDLISKEIYNDKKELKKYADIAYSNCKSLKILIDDLFEYSKLNGTELKINKVSINLGELLEQVVLGFIPSFEEFGMRYKLSFTNEKVILNADPILMARMFENIINNAIKYGKEGKYIDTILMKEGSDAVVKIINYGQPIPDEDLPNIFERFYRVDKSRSDVNSGSGLGLAIVKSIAEKHNGKVLVFSNENQTTFEIRLKNSK